MNYAIILAGGIGSRFWPLSRKALPKQFLRIIGKDTFFEATIRRLKGLIPSNNIFIVTNKNYLSQIKGEIRGFRIPEGNIILEPEPLNTLPAIGLCAQLINLKDSRANLIVLPSDHYIRGDRGFKDTLRQAIRLSEQDLVCLMGIAPDNPCSGYGYIKTGANISKGLFWVDSFIEKPAMHAAKRLLKRRNVFWNSGMFSFKATVILEEIKRYVPLLYARISRIRHKKNIARLWPKIKPVSIDYGILQKSKRLAMVRARFYWRDLGSWDALYSVLPKDRSGNVMLSDCIELNSSNIFACAYGTKRLIATIGLRDTIIVDTPDALLVCKKENAQNIKSLVELLKQRRSDCV